MAVWLNLNTAKLYLILVIVMMLTLVAWSAIRLAYDDEPAFTSVTLAVSIVSGVLISLVFYQASCAFPGQPME